MKQQILKEHNPIIIFLINCPCHASVVVYCLVLLELTSLLQGWFSALNILSAFWLLSDTISTGHIPQHSTWHPANKATVAYKFCGSAPEPRLQLSHFAGSHSCDLGVAAVWYNFTPFSSEPVKENTIWNISEFTELTLCQILPPSL